MAATREKTKRALLRVMGYKSSLNRKGQGQRGCPARRGVQGLKLPCAVRKGCLFFSFGWTADPEQDSKIDSVLQESCEDDVSAIDKPCA
jgi:hypothetical protein